ncbi:hypothetical protein [Mucilaginibacter phyllosphaerae]|uniref:Uncharacterized protein n=1 Tax=Mucilaginibacter phyllosphaerae TaxID=1812349 RepID=A0A4Y8AJB3_9SPHI|nr:hypothetical protein [Mucilaginibacter phyllosphaerae]MBB3967838.1 hypothetical protein [Mucilaginibacter phyllosphaerae]TEW69118.1 hypothetical protein E2R65_02830 [Mucilaginibacter phyllosphaerae]GGH02972.1 hypothetical protein GCM10007352_05450 [Mucilaginibacter phyllosphaerae]
MDELISTSTANFFYFLMAGSVIVYLILKFDAQNRKRINNIMKQAKNVEPMLMKKSAQRKLQEIKVACKDQKPESSVVEQQLDELVKAYDKGQISLPDYCNKLNSLLAMSA